MVRLLVAAYLIAHGFVHVAIYVTPPDPSKPPPFDPHRSWALALSRPRRRPSKSPASSSPG